jgi:hypothetical protein
MMDWRNNKIGMGSVHIDKNAGDITFDNADCNEDFEVSANEDAEPGMVMALNDVGYQEKSMPPNDKRFAGVVSGAGDLKPELVWGRKMAQQNSLPITLISKVYCKVDAKYGPVKVGAEKIHYG